MKSFCTEQKTKSQEKSRTQQIILELNESKLWPKVFVGALLPKMKFWFISHKKYFCNANDCHYIICKIWIKTEVQMCTTGKTLRPVCAQLNKRHTNKKNVKFKGPLHKATDPYSFLDSWWALRPMWLTWALTTQSPWKGLAIRNSNEPLPKAWLQYSWTRNTGGFWNPSCHLHKALLNHTYSGTSP